MATVKVKTVQGRVAFQDAACKLQIPNDKFVTVQMTPHIDRLINVHGDLEVQPVEPTQINMTAAPNVAPNTPSSPLAAIQAVASINQ